MTSDVESLGSYSMIRSASEDPTPPSPTPSFGSQNHVTPGGDRDDGTATTVQSSDPLHPLHDSQTGVYNYGRILALPTSTSSTVPLLRMGPSTAQLERWEARQGQGAQSHQLHPRRRSPRPSAHTIAQPGRGPMPM